MVQNESIQLCPNCQTGHDTYMLDNKEPFCPFLHMHRGGECRAYIRIQTEIKEA